jgi:hypothetical protein
VAARESPLSKIDIEQHGVREPLADGGKHAKIISQWGHWRGVLRLVGRYLYNSLVLDTKRHVNHCAKRDPG